MDFNPVASHFDATDGVFFPHTGLSEGKMTVVPNCRRRSVWRRGVSRFRIVTVVHSVLLFEEMCVCVCVCVCVLSLIHI